MCISLLEDMHIDLREGGRNRKRNMSMWNIDWLSPIYVPTRIEPATFLLCRMILQLSHSGWGRSHLMEMKKKRLHTK